MILEVAKKREEKEERRKDKRGGEKFKNTSKFILGARINQEDLHY